MHDLVAGAEMWPRVVPAGGKCFSRRGCQQRVGVINPRVEDAYVDIGFPTSFRSAILQFLDRALPTHCRHPSDSRFNGR